MTHGCVISVQYLVVQLVDVTLLIPFSPVAVDVCFFVGEFNGSDTRGSIKGFELLAVHPLVRRHEE